MNDQERRDAFVTAVEKIVQQHGLTFQAALVPEMLGVVLQVRAQLQVIPLAGWSPPLPPKPPIVVIAEPDATIVPTNDAPPDRTAIANRHSEGIANDR